MAKDSPQPRFNQSSGNSTVKRPIISFLLAGVILAPSVSYAILADAPLLPILSLVVLIVSVLQKRPFSVTTRSVVYLLTLGAFVAVVYYLAYPIDEDRFFSPLPTDILFPIVIATCLVLTFLPQSPLLITVILSLSLFSMTLHGTSVNDPLNIRFVLPFDLASNRFWVFGFFLFLQMAAVLPLLSFTQQGDNTRSSSIQRVKKRFLMHSMSWFILVGLTILSCKLAIKIEFMMEPFFKSFLSMYLESFRSKILFTPEVDLFRKIRKDIRHNKDKIVLRARSVNPPGYLRGRVYDDYREGRWKSTGNEPSSNLPVDQNFGNGTVKRFIRRFSNATKIESNPQQIDIFPAHYFYSDVLLAPGDSYAFELVAEGIQSGSAGVLSPKGWDGDAGYTIIGENKKIDSAFTNFGPPGEQIKIFFKEIDSILAVELNQIASTIFKIPQETSLEKIRRLEAYLLSSYRYELLSQPSTELDPILNFLNHTKSGHCELFASSAALLLRTQGIATRYVTGFVCLEGTSQNNNWLARLGDCHAWVEAWIPEKKEWQLVEATPPSGIPEGTKRSSTLQGFVEIPLFFWKSIYAYIKRGYFTEAVLSVLSGFSTFLYWIFWQGPWYLGWGFLLGIWALIYQKRSRIRRSQRGFEDVRSVCLKNLYQEIEALLKQLQIHRTNSMTLRDIAKRIKDKESCDGLELTSILKGYENLRYRQEIPEKSQIKKIKDQIKIWRK